MEWSVIYTKPQPLLHSFPTSHLLLPVSNFPQKDCLFLGSHAPRLHSVRFRRSEHRCRRSSNSLRTVTTRCVLGDGLVGVDVILVSSALLTVCIGIAMVYVERQRRRDQTDEFSVPETHDGLENGNLKGNNRQTSSIDSCNVTSLNEGNEGVLPSEEQLFFNSNQGIRNLEFGGDVLMYDGVLMSSLAQETSLDIFSPCKDKQMRTNEQSGLCFEDEKVTNAHVIENDSVRGSDKQEEISEFSLDSDTVAYSSLNILNDMLTQVVNDNQLVDRISVECELPVSKSNDCNEIPAFDFRILNQMPQKFSLQNSCCNGLGADLEKGEGKQIKNLKSLKRNGRKTLINQTRSTTTENSRNPKEKGTHVDSDISLMNQNKSRKTKRHPEPYRRSVKEATDLSSCLISYNYLIRGARLKDCIELLENMDTKGILDMDKIYHSRFLQTCKSQKSVEEAFRFTKLIKNPTLSTFNMLLSVCASSGDYEGALQVLLFVKEAGLRPDSQLYTTLISTCGKSGKVEAMFEVFHEMINAGVEATVHTYGALIDGCARARQVAKAFGAYGIMRSKNVNPDRVIFNTLITACGQSGAVDRAFDVLGEMMAEPRPINPDHITIGALMKTCIQNNQADRAYEVFKMLERYKIKGNLNVYTIAVHSCSLTGNLEFALNIYRDMENNGIEPDEMFLSTLVDVAGHSRNIEVGFEILSEARSKGMQLGNMLYSSLMGACSNSKNWKKALELYEEFKILKLSLSVSILNALVTSLCDGDQLVKAVEILNEIKEVGIQPNTVTYSILLVACERKNEIELGFELFSQLINDRVLPNLVMCQCLTDMCLQRFEKVYSVGDPFFSNLSKPQIDNKWTKWAILAYRHTISSGIIPSIEAFSHVLGCLKFPNDNSLRKSFFENMGLVLDNKRHSNAYSLLDGFGEYDPRSFAMFEEASSLGVVPCISFKDMPIVVDTRNLQIHTAQVYLLTILKGLKHRHAAGARLPNLTILFPVKRSKFLSPESEKRINVAGRVGCAVSAMLRRLGLHYKGDESYGKIRISGISLRRWFKPKVSFTSYAGKLADFTSSKSHLAKEITNQQRNIRSSYRID